MNSFELSQEPLSESRARALLADATCGALVIFVGTVRDSARGADVTHLEFESYEPMVMKVLNKLANEIREKFGVKGVLLHHRLGKVEVGEAAVIAGISSPHRAEAFAACAYLMERLKEIVPIWKKEFTSEGGMWISLHP
ncbi:MAG: molybdenum cofactor biosynthesis protein MoaE [Flavobacteriales bacterium]